MSRCLLNQRVRIIMHMLSRPELSDLLFPGVYAFNGWSSVSGALCLLSHLITVGVSRVRSVVVVALVEVVEVVEGLVLPQQQHKQPIGGASLLYNLLGLNAELQTKSLVCGKNQCFANLLHQPFRHSL